MRLGALLRGIPLTLAWAGVAYAGGLGLTYRALTIGQVSIVAPIVATEGAIGAVIAVALGDTIGLSAAILLGVIAIGVVLAAIEGHGVREVAALVGAPVGTVKSRLFEARRRLQELLR